MNLKVMNRVVLGKTKQKRNYPQIYFQNHLENTLKTSLREKHRNITIESVSGMEIGRCNVLNP